MNESTVYDSLNRNWKATTKAILGSEIGELAEFEGWLSEYRDPLVTRKSGVSGSDVTFAIPDYAKNSKWIGFDELDFGKKFEPLTINEMKDIDSIAEAVRERAFYAGNIVLGNSKGVIGSANVTDSFYVLGSSFISDSKYIAYTSFARYSESLYGCNNDAKSVFVIRATNPGEIKRGLELWDTYYCSDAYFSFGCLDCRDCMFSFNLRGKNRVIGNLELEKDKYMRIKKRLLGQMVEELERKKRLPTLIDMIGPPEHDAGILRRIMEKTVYEEERADMKPIEESFSETSKIVLGRELGGVDKYGDWLMEHVRPISIEKSAVSGKRLVAADIIPTNVYPKDRLVKPAEALAAGLTLRLNEKEADGISLDNAGEHIARLAYYYTEVRLRENVNMIDVAMAYNASNCYHGGMFSNVKLSAFSFWPRNSEHMFGSNTSFSCSFCMNAYYSNRISRSFEIDCSNDCSGAYFLHNCENVHDSMFCFNGKNLRRAIGNAPLPPGGYEKVKSSVLEQVAGEIERKKSLKWSIYNIGGSR